MLNWIFEIEHFFNIETVYLCKTEFLEMKLFLFFFYIEAVYLW